MANHELIAQPRNVGYNLFFNFQANYNYVVI